MMLVRRLSGNVGSSVTKKANCQKLTFALILILDAHIGVFIAMLDL